MNYTLWINKELRFLPFVFRDAVDWEEWYQDWSFLDIFLEVGGVAVGDSFEIGEMFFYSLGWDADFHSESRGTQSAILCKKNDYFLPTF